MKYNKYIDCSNLFKLFDVHFYCSNKYWSYKFETHGKYLKYNLCFYETDKTLYFIKRLLFLNNIDYTNKICDGIEYLYININKYQSFKKHLNIIKLCGEKVNKIKFTKIKYDKKQLKNIFSEI